MGGPKMRVLHEPTASYGAEILRDVRKHPYTIYGGATIACNSSPGPPTTKAVQTYVQATKALFAAGLSRQDQQLILRFMNKRLAYVFKATHPRIARQWVYAADEATELALRTLLNVTQLSLSAWTQIHSELHHAGWGFTTLGDCELLFAEATNATKDLNEDDMHAALHQRKTSAASAKASERFAAARDSHTLALSGVSWKYNMLTIYPTMKELEISDGAFQRAIGMLVNMPVDHDMYVCAEYFNPTAAHASRNIAPDHNKTCSRCLRAVKNIRHEELLMKFIKKNAFYGKVLSVGVRALLGEAAHVNGQDLIPDAYCFSSAGAPATIFYDTRISHASVSRGNNTANSPQIQQSYAEKKTHYRPLMNDNRSSSAIGPARVIEPIIFNTHGMPSTETAKCIERMGKELRPGFARECISACTMRVLEVQHRALEWWFDANKSQLSRGGQAANQHQYIVRRPVISAAAEAQAALAAQPPRAAPPMPAGTGAAQTPPTAQQAKAATRAAKTARDNDSAVCDCGNKLGKDGMCASGATCPVLLKKNFTSGSERRRKKQFESDRKDPK